MKDLHSRASLATIFGPIAMNADNTPVAIDLLNARGVEILLAIGAGGITFDGTNKIEFKLTHSDDDSVYTAVTVDDLLGVASVGTGGIVKSLIAAHATATTYRFGYKGSKRYLKLLADFSGTHGSATPLYAGVLVDGKINPAANAI